MTQRDRVMHSGYSHALLVHDDDDQLVEGTRAFVERGLASGGHVLVHGTRARVGLMREVLETDPRLEYGFDEELYLEPTTTLFAYQRKLAESQQEQREFWVTGTVPLGNDAAARAAWARYESAVNEALSSYPFHALCTYDTRTNPAPVIEAARATHPTVSIDPTSSTSLKYVDPATFLTDPMAQVPGPPAWPPSSSTTVSHVDHLAGARHDLEASARESSAVPEQSIHTFLVAVNEVVANGLVHGTPPVRITLWADVGTLTCMVEDSGTWILDSLAGFRHPDESSSLGLWVARQLVDDMFIGSPPERGCRVLLIKT